MSSSPKEPAKADETSEIADLATILIAVNRITSRLENRPEFSELNFSVPDWLLLTAVQNNPTVSMTELSQKTGVTRQRVHQQALALEQAGFAAVTKVEGDEKKRTVALTADGARLMKKIDKSLHLALVGTDGASVSQPLKTGGKVLLKIARTLLPHKDKEKEKG